MPFVREYLKVFNGGFTVEVKYSLEGNLQSALVWIDTYPDGATDVFKFLKNNLKLKNVNGVSFETIPDIKRAITNWLEDHRHRQPGEKKMLQTKEFYDVMDMFEKTFDYVGRKESKEEWPRQHYYCSGKLNTEFIAFLAGYSFGKTINN